MRGWIAAALLAGLLAGCSGAPEGKADEAGGAPVATVGEGLTVVETEDGYGLSRPLAANDTLTAPVPWRVGDWFGVHVYIVGDDPAGTHYNTIVVDETPTEWMLATDDPEGAKDEAVWDIPILGAFSKDNLGTTGLGGQWDLLRFPLSDGATWSSEVALEIETGGSLPIEFEATFNPAIPTPGGPEPGYDIRGVDSHANLTLEFDYVPALGWFTRFFVYDTATEQADDYIVKAVSMGTGTGWTGTYYIDTAEPVVQHYSVTGADPDGFPPQLIHEGTATPADFTVSADAAYLYGYVFSFVFQGEHVTSLVTPANEVRRWEAQDTGLQFDEVFAFVNEEAQPGAWRVALTGAGVAFGGGAFLWEVYENTGTL